LSSSTISSELDGLESDMVSISHLYPEFCAIAVVSRAKHPAHVLLHDGLRHEQSDSGSPLGPLGGKVGVEDPVHDLLGYAASVVGNGYDGRVFFPVYRDRHPGVVYFPFYQGIPGIGQDIEKHL